MEFPGKTVVQVNVCEATGTAYYQNATCRMRDQTSFIREKQRHFMVTFYDYLSTTRMLYINHLA